MATLGWTPSHNVPAAWGRSPLWPAAAWRVACFCLAADAAGCETAERGGAGLGKGLDMSIGKCESQGFQL